LKDFFISPFWYRLNFVPFHLVHDQNILLSMNVALTYYHYLQKMFIKLVPVSANNVISVIEYPKNFVSKMERRELTKNCFKNIHNTYIFIYVIIYLNIYQFCYILGLFFQTNIVVCNSMMFIKLKIQIENYSYLYI
jgi:hypothetical protein